MDSHNLKIYYKISGLIIILIFSIQAVDVVFKLLPFSNLEAFIQEQKMAWYFLRPSYLKNVVPLCYALLVIGIIFYCVLCFSKNIGNRIKQIDLWQIISFLTLALFAAQVKHGIIKCESLEFYNTFSYVLEKHALASPAVMFFAFVGLFLRNKPGYVLLMILTYVSIGDLIKGFICCTEFQIGFLQDHWLTELMFIVIAPVIYVQRIMRNYFKLHSRQHLFLCNLLAFLVAGYLVLFLWEK